MRTTAIVLVCLAVAALPAQEQEPFRHDFETAWREVRSTYAYFDSKATKWSEIPRLYGADLRKVTTREEFVGLLERVLEELYDPHAHLTVNLPTSPRLVPTGTDLWAEWQANQAVITQVRQDSNAERSGVRPGTVVVAIDGVAIRDAVDARLGRSYVSSDGEARNWALRAVLAGRRNVRRVVQLRHGSDSRMVILEANDRYGGPWTSPLHHGEIRKGIGYIRFHDSLGDDSTIAAFDLALASLREATALIVDLRNTPSGGNTTVARAVLGRFVTHEQPYQKHVLASEERTTGVRRSWVELVSPRGTFTYRKPVAVLVGRWTGSMGEGLAMGFDATGAGTVVGTRMAGLLGATYRIALPNTGVGISVPAERLYHLDGTPREMFNPKIFVNVERGGAAGDPFITAALRAIGAP